jgi:hypothetical protein
MQETGRASCASRFLGVGDERSASSPSEPTPISEMCAAGRLQSSAATAAGDGTRAQHVADYATKKELGI